MASTTDESYEWVELLDPKSQRTMYVNLDSGECCWDPPKNQTVKPLSSDQWWELFDVKAQRNYYYNSITRETVWQRPSNGDIIPLANLQLLQQNMQQAANTPNQDIGMLRRSSSKVSSSSTTTTGNRRVHSRKVPTSILEDSTKPGSDLEQSNRTDAQDCFSREEPAPRRPSVDPISLASEQLHRLSTQNVGAAYRPYGNQRVRDWLREAGVAWEHSDASVAHTPAQTAVDGTERKNSGCFSDRPARRIHSFTSQNATHAPRQPTDQSSECLLTPNTETPTLDLVQPVKMPVRNSSDLALPRPGSTQPDLAGAWIPEQLRHSSEASRAQRDLRSISGPSASHMDARKSLTPSSFSDKADGARFKGTTGDDFVTSVPSKSTVLEKEDLHRRNTPHSKPLNGQPQRPTALQNERNAYPVVTGINRDANPAVTRHRAFPRTNPTVSRPVVSGGTASRPVRFSATTLDRPVNANYTSVGTSSNTNDQRTSIGAATSVHRNPAFNVIHFSNTDLRTNAPEVANGSDNASRPMDHANDQQEHVQCRSLRDNPSAFDMPLVLSNQAPTMPSYYQLGVKAPLLGSSNNKNNSNSPNSSSPQPSSSSSSSSSSFSRASSGTALTNTDSEENKQIVHSAPNQSLDSAVQVFPTPRRASLNHENKSLELNAFQPQLSLAAASEQADGNIDLDQPPVPPPRSASTLGPNRLLQHCTSDFYRLAQGGVFLRSDPYVLAQRPYALCYPRYPNYMTHQPVPHLDGGPINDNCTVSSLSRKDPARMNVILPHHRRPPPFVYQARPPCPISGTTTVYYVHPFDVLVQDTASNCTNNSFVGQSAVHHRLSSTSSPLLPSTGVELCSIGGNGNGPTGATSPSTATTWVSHSTATWDLDKLRTEHGLCIPTSESEQQMQSLASTLPQTGDPVSSVSATSTGQTATTSAVVLQRSPSGGFIGPEELNDSVWFSTSDRERSTGPPVPLFTLVQPGHPQFPSFIAPFEWSRTLFKPDQDVATLMSWTKSTFSKRLLVSTEPNMKKQVADTFKIVQSFMGDRKARLSLPDYGSIIVHRALNTVGLRDEIFAQLCKQTTANPDIKSLTNGWALICVCLYYFPPNSKFRDALLAYLNARAEAAVSLVFQSAHSLNKVPSSLEAAAAIASGLAPIVSELNSTSNLNGPSYSQIMPAAATTTISTNVTTATRGSTIGSVKSDALISDTSDLVDTEFNVSASGRRTNCSQLNTARQFEFAVGLWDRPTAAHFARVAPRWFVRALNVGSRKLLEAPSIEEICHVKDFILKPSIFGGTLTEMMRIQAYRFPHLRLPWIQIFLTEELLRLKGPVTEGVFRLSPDLDLVTEIRCQLEKLFEIFRVVHVCVLDPECNQTDDLQHPPECFRILRPPPAGWSLSAREFETETAPLSDEENRGAVQKSAPILDQSIPLTGAFTWPLAPVRISSPPSEYVLLTPTDQWPRSLSDMAARILNNSAGDVQIDPHLAAGLLKLWLREMADPLIPVELQPDCLKAACEAEVFESQHLMSKDSSLSETVSNPNPIQVCCSLVRKIPPLERRSLLYLILLLQHLAKRENASRSLMDPRNLATVIAPNLMRSSSTNPRDLLENIRPQTLFVRLLISYLDVDAELQHLLTTVRTEDDAMCVGADLDGMWSRTPDPGPGTWAAPVRVRLGSDNGLLPA